MKTTVNIPVLNCVRRPGRSLALMLLSAVLCFTVLAGSLLISGLRSGMDSLEERLGADIMVVPYEATTKTKLDDMILQGNPGYFYMSTETAGKIYARDGIGEISSQIFLASTAASCCSYKVQLIGYDPETDFTVSPWVSKTYSGTPGYMEVLVGSDLSAYPGDTVQFYGTQLTVAGRLDKTGTYLDTSVFMDMDTIRTLINSARERNPNEFSGVNADKVVSCVLLNVADGYDINSVLNDINIHVRKVEAVRTSSMISDVSYKLSGIAGISDILIGVIWALVLIILILSYTMIANERRKEYAVQRLLGMSRSALAGNLLTETLLISVCGSAIGAVFAVLAAKLFASGIETALSMPFLLPSGSGMALLIAAAVAASVLASSISAAVSAYRVSRIETAVALRGEN